MTDGSELSLIDVVSGSDDDRSMVERLDVYLTQYPNAISILELLPAFGWIILLFGASLVIVFVFSFMQNPPLDTGLTTEHYTYVLSQSLYLEVIWDSLIIGIVTTILTLVLAFPAAYYLAVIKRKRQTLYLILLILPFWINIVVRTLSWRQILNSSGLFAWILVDILGVIDSFNLLYTQWGVTLGLIHVFLPFMIIPIYTTLAGIDKSHIEAAQNLGANKIQAFFEITLPQALPGIAAGVVLVFVLGVGAYVTPLLLGGQKAAMIANIIGSVFTLVRQWGVGSALSVVYTVVVVIIIYLFNRSVGLENLYGGDES